MAVFFFFFVFWGEWGGGGGVQPVVYLLTWVCMIGCISVSLHKINIFKWKQEHNELTLYRKALLMAFGGNCSTKRVS